MAADCEFVHSSLKELIKQHNKDAELSGIDDIVVSYVVGVVEDAVAGEPVDVEGVMELVSAYEPCFSDVPYKQVEAWLDRTVQTVKDLQEKGKESRAITLDSIVSSFTCEAKTRPQPTTPVAAPPVQVPCSGKQRKCSTSSSSASSSSSVSSSSSSSCTSGGGSSSSSDVETLLELFPDACRVDVERCLLTTAGDVQEAICLMLDSPPSAQNNRLSALETAVGKTGCGKLVDDKAVKASIINKYSFIDHDEDRREHRPLMPKWEGKKMVRYRDNKVVSLKGERYTEIKKEESDDLKKTYVNLKPGRQYRFH